MSNKSYTPAEWRADLGEQIKHAREKANLTQEELATRVGRKRGSINSYEKGKGNPEFQVVAQIAAALGQAFNILGCRIGPEHAIRATLPAEQLQLAFDHDHTFLANLTIRPSRESIQITAIGKYEDKLA